MFGGNEAKPDITSESAVWEDYLTTLDGLAFFGSFHWIGWTILGSQSPGVGLFIFFQILFSFCKSFLLGVGTDLLSTHIAFPGFHVCPQRFVGILRSS